MTITLKTGENLNLELSPIIFEYIEEYPGGIKQLKKDSSGEVDENGYTKIMYAVNHLLYSVIASNYHESLTYRQAIKLVKLEDIDKIINFVIENLPNLNESTNKLKSNFSTNNHRL